MNESIQPPLKTHDDVLEALAQAIDIPDSLFETATERYRAIGKHLERKGSPIEKFSPEIYPQGSMLLGTVIRPLSDSDEFDLDLVCLLNATKNDFTQRGLKNSVGIEVKSYATTNNMQKPVKEKQRCWRLEYSNSESFHMDILPAIPDRDAYKAFLTAKGHTDLAADPRVVDHAIAITDPDHGVQGNYDTLTSDWPASNPKGFAAWFMSRQAQEMERKKRIQVDRGTYMKVDDVPDHKVKTPLQRSIQLLKRHRDSLFEGHDDAPISIIISTLSARAYNGEQTISSALRTILGTMASFITVEGGKKVVKNPVNPEENFADKWEKFPAREKAFHDWVETAQRDFARFLAAPITGIPSSFEDAMTATTMSKVKKHISLSTPAVAVTGLKAEAEAYKQSGINHQPWKH